MLKLNHIETFITVTRHMNFNDAAKELHVSPSTISRRIKNLEAAIEDSLFIRNGNQLQLTRIGKDFLDIANSAKQTLETGINKLRSQASRSLHVQTLRAFSKHYIAPYLQDFESHHPGWELRIQVDENNGGLSKDSFDVALLIGGEDWNGLESELIKPCACSFVCAPRLADGRSPPTRIDQLSEYPLLGFKQHPGLWPEVFGWFGLKNLNGCETRFFEDEDLLYQAAAQGRGIAVAASPFIDDMINSRKLVWPMDVEFSLGHGMYLVYAPQQRLNPGVQAFRLWIKEQIKRVDGGTDKAAP